MSVTAVAGVSRYDRATVFARALLVSAAVAVQAGACSLLMDLDRPGARFLRRASSFPAWSADGRNIYFTDRKGSGITEITIHAVDVASGRTRELAKVTGLNHGEQLRTATDPSVVYASIAHPDWSLQLKIYRVPAAGGPVETVANNVGIPWFVISSSGNHVAYPGSRYDSDTVYVVATTGPGSATAMPTTGSRPRAMGLSPAGTLLLYSSSTGIYMAPVSGGAHQLVWQSVDGQDDAVAPQVLWRGESPHLLVATDSAPHDVGGIALHEVDATSGERTLLGTMPRHLPEAAGWQLARSGDGRSFAVWVPVAVTHKSVERTTFRFRLYVQTPRDVEPRSVLEWEADEPLRWFEFSPDGRQIGLLLSGSLHVVELDE
jgi:hypothetical protein